MAKRVIPDYYSFNPSTRTITIPNRVLLRDQLLLVTNASSNTVIFNFSDPDLSITSFTAPYSSTGTQFTLNYNTTAMGTGDPLLIMVDEVAETFQPIEVMQDPTNKLRVASPQSLIDTDFEYGLQPIKWESITTLNNVPGYYVKSGGNSLPVSALSGDNTSPRSTVTVTTTTPHNVSTGDVVNVVYTGNANGEGAFLVTSVASTTTFSYIAKGQINGSFYQSSTAILSGSVFDSDNSTSRLQIAAAGVQTADASAPPATTGATYVVNTQGRHGLSPGAPIMVRDSGTTSANGQWVVFDVPTTNSFRFQTPGSGSLTAAVTTSAPFCITVRPEANFVHRPSDGGVMINTVNTQQGVTAVRQSRRYFRYQSGKGIQMSTGTKFTPSFDLNTLTAVGTLATATVQQALNIQSGTTIVVEGVVTNANSANYYNGTFTVTSVLVTATNRQLSWVMSGTPTDTSPGGITPQITVKNWKGAAVRVGFFDYQNGFYFEYDGSTFFVVRRNATKELMGTVSVTANTTTVTGTNTMFHKQVVAGDTVVIRGMSYQVVSVDAGNILEISPAYRGATNVSGVRMNLVQNIRTPQSSWNLDRCDGTGPSGYVLDVTKMQMCYIDYTWYGAGFCRFGFRLTDGNVVFVHKVANNNVNNQAYMRSGNLPARYEVTNIGPFTRMVSNNNASGGLPLQASDSSVLVADATYWPTSGQIMVTQTSNVEIMSYSGKVQNTSVLLNGQSTWYLTNLTRRLFGANTSNLIFTPSEYEGGTAGQTSQTALAFITCDCAPVVMHWGTSVIMDGGFNDDRSIQFAYTKQATLSLPANTSIAVLSIRLAPSVDNSVTGQFGVREIVNRMQLQTRSLGIATTTSIIVLGILNAQFPNQGLGTQPVFPGNWTITSVVSTIGTGSLAQIIDHTGVTTIVTGGEQIFGFVTANSADNFDISQVRDIGASIVSGNGSTKTPGYPVGPDVLTIVLKNTTAAAVPVQNFRLSWTEAQA